MVRRLLSGGAPGPRRASAGFTLVEVMVAMVVTIIVLIANLTIFNTAQKNLAYGRAMTTATNLATEKVADFRNMTLEGIFAAAPTTVATAPLTIQTGTDPTPIVRDGVSFTRLWTVSDVDLDQDGTADLEEELVKVRLDVTWAVGGRSHRVSMGTFIAEKVE